MMCMLCVRARLTAGPVFHFLGWVLSSRSSVAVILVCGHKSSRILQWCMFLCVCVRPNGHAAGDKIMLCTSTLWGLFPLFSCLYRLPFILHYYYLAWMINFVKLIQRKLKQHLLIFLCSYAVHQCTLFIIFSSRTFPRPVRAEIWCLPHKSCITIFICFY